VSSDSGQPLSDVSVFVGSTSVINVSGLRSQTTDAEGIAKFPGVVGPTNVSAASGTGMTAGIRAMPEEGQELSVTLKLPAEGRSVEIVLNGKGRGEAQNSDVTLTIGNWGSHWVMDGDPAIVQRRIPKDASGRCTLYVGREEKEHWSFVWESVEQAFPGGRMQVALPSLAEVNVTLQSAEGRRIAGVSLEVSGSDLRTAPGVRRTDASGTASFRLVPGTYSLSLQGFASTGSIEGITVLEGVEQSVVRTVAGVSLISGHVTRADGSLVSKVSGGKVVGVQAARGSAYRTGTSCSLRG
jgi:hypothetical protein